MKRTVRILQAIFWISIAIGLAMVALFETNVLLEGDLSGNGVVEYYWTLAMELITIVAIPTALRLFRFGGVRRRLASDKQSLLPLALLRMALLALPMLANALLYYLFMSTTFGYMGIICLLCMTFVYPSAQRCEAEVKNEERGEPSSQLKN